MVDAETVLGIIGGVFGLLGGVFAIFMGGLVAALGEGSDVIYLGFGAIIFSIIGIIGSVLSNKKYAGILMVVAGIFGLIMVSYAYIIAAPLLVIGGILAFRKRNK